MALNRIMAVASLVVALAVLYLVASGQSYRNGFVQGYEAGLSASTILLHQR